jgi:hypothetical protein
VVAGNLARAFAAAGSTAAVTATSDDATAELAEYPELRGALVMLPRNASLDANTLSRMAGAGYLVVAAHDASRSADAQTVARSSDAALIVIEEGTTGLAADAVLAQLDAVSAPVLGAVLAPPARWWRRSEHFAKTRPSRAEPQPRRVDVDGPPNEPTASGDGTRVPASAPIRHKR